MQAGGKQYGARRQSSATSFIGLGETDLYHARRSAPGRSCSNSNLEVCPGLFPVAVGFDGGFASASLALIAFSFLFLFPPFFFFRCFWLGMLRLRYVWCRSSSAFPKNVYRFADYLT